MEGKKTRSRGINSFFPILGQKRSHRMDQEETEDASRATDALIPGTIVAQRQSTLRVTPFTATTIQLRRVPVIALHSPIPRGCPSPVLRSISKASMTPNGRECTRGCTSQKMGKGCFAAYASVLTLATNGILLPFST